MINEGHCTFSPLYRSTETKAVSYHHSHNFLGIFTFANNVGNIIDRSHVVLVSTNEMKRKKTKKKKKHLSPAYEIPMKSTI